MEHATLGDLVKVAHHIRKDFPINRRAKRYMYMTQWTVLERAFPDNPWCWTIAGAVSLGYANRVVAAFDARDTGAYL